MKVEGGGAVTSKVESEEEREKARAQVLVDKLKFHTVVKHVPSHKEQALPLIVNQGQLRLRDESVDA